MLSTKTKKITLLEGNLGELEKLIGYIPKYLGHCEIRYTPGGDDEDHNHVNGGIHFKATINGAVSEKLSFRRTAFSDLVPRNFNYLLQEVRGILAENNLVIVNLKRNEYGGKPMIFEGGFFGSGWKFNFNWCPAITGDLYKFKK